MRSKRRISNRKKKQKERTNLRRSQKRTNRRRSKKRRTNLRRTQHRTNRRRVRTNLRRTITKKSKRYSNKRRRVLRGGAELSAEQFFAGVDPAAAIAAPAPAAAPAAPAPAAAPTAAAPLSAADFFAGHGAPAPAAAPAVAAPAVAAPVWSPITFQTYFQNHFYNITLDQIYGYKYFLKIDGDRESMTMLGQFICGKEYGKHMILPKIIIEGIKNHVGIDIQKIDRDDCGKASKHEDHWIIYLN